MLSLKKENNKIYLKKNNNVVSFINDLKYKHAGYYRMICEIPKGTNAKMEVSNNIKNNPIIHDKFKGEKRYFQYGNIKWNYGAIPQTIEDLNHIYKETGLKGDGDPLDIIDISNIELNIGDIIWVKIIGAIPLIDEGETDWKIIGINKNDPNIDKINDIDDLDLNMTNDLLDWFTNYKKISKGITNVIGMDNKIQMKNLALSVIETCHILWKKKNKKKYN